jgi:hypothetical protein
MRIDVCPFPRAVQVAVPVEPVLYALAGARWPANWQGGMCQIDPPLDLAKVVFWVETPCDDIAEAEAWAGIYYWQICAQVRRSLLTPPVLN